MKRQLAHLLILPLLALALPPRAGAAAAPVALVVGVSGQATALDAARQERPLRLFDKLPEGTTVRTGPASTVRILFTGGARFAVEERSQVRLARADLRALSGSVVALAPVPAGLVLSPISPEDDPGDRFPTIVIRTQAMTGVYPRGDVTLEPASAVLRFDPVPGTPKYRVSVSDQASGDVVFQLDTQATEVLVPADRLKRGKRYSWSVQTKGRFGSRAEGRGAFRIYTAEAEKARAALDDALAGEPELDALLLKIAVDLNLGRYREVYERLQEASLRLPGDSGLAAAAKSWGERLEEPNVAKASPPASHPSAKPPTLSSNGGTSSW